VCERRATAAASDGVGVCSSCTSSVSSPTSATSTISAEASARIRTPRLPSAPKRIGLPVLERIRFSFSSRTASKAPSL
jgi:hypothetical protein